MKKGKDLPGTELEWKRRLTPQQYEVTRNGATEPPFSGAYWQHNENGFYYCICCGACLFKSTCKYESGCGWPSFFAPIDEEVVRTREDLSLGMQRLEVLCNRCDAHLGHVFPDGPEPTGLRFCMNSASLDLEELE